MNNLLFIPKTIRVGFQKRSGTYTGNLAYVIYYDQKGVLRKEKSWESWRHKDIEPQNFKNVPTSGFVINKNVERYGWSHFSSNKSYIRIHDPRGFEFEVTPENLIGLLMNSDCLKRGFQGEFVYAWSGTELVLLPVNCEEYGKSIEHTQRQSKKVGVKDLIPGLSYKTKKGKDLVYLGKFDWYDHYEYNNKHSKKYIFFDREKEDKYYYGFGFEPKAGLDFLAYANSSNVVSNYAELIEKFKKSKHSSKIESLRKADISLNEFLEDKKKPYCFSTGGRYTGLYIKFGDDFHFYNISVYHNGTISCRKEHTYSLGKPFSFTRNDNLNGGLFYHQMTDFELIKDKAACYELVLENGATIKL